MTINAKYLNEYLKKGWDTKDFSTALGIEEDQFVALLEKTFVSRTLSGFRRRLKVNESQKKKKKKKNTSTSEVADVVVLEEVIEDSIENDDSNNNSTICETKQSTPNSSLDELEEMRKSISSQLCEMEAKIIAFKRTKKFAFDKLAEEESWISKFIQELNTHQKNAEEIVAAINTATDEIRQLQSNKKALRGQLSQIQDSIQAARKITIFAVSQEDTVIESESSIPEYNASYDLELFNKLVSSDLSELSTVRQLKYVASLIKYCHMLTDMNRTYEITFDSSSSEKLFFEFF